MNDAKHRGRLQRVRGACVIFGLVADLLGVAMYVVALNVPPAGPYFRAQLLSGFSKGLVNPANGPVQPAPEINVVFWGDGWKQHPDAVNTILNFYRRLPGSQFSVLLSQNGGAGSSPRLNADVIDSVGLPTATVTAADVEAEVVRQARTQGWRLGPNTQTVIITAPDIAVDASFSGGEHFSGDPVGVRPDGMTTWTLVPSGPAVIGPEAWGDEWLAIITRVLSHEYAESATDPIFLQSYLGAYRGGILPVLGEVADLCDAVPAAVSSVNGTTVHTAALWDNRTRQCVAAPESPPAPPSPKSGPGTTTVVISSDGHPVMIVTPVAKVPVSHPTSRRNLSAPDNGGCAL